MSQTTEVGECSWLHAYCASLTASLLLWGQMQRGRRHLAGLQEEWGKASGKVFQAQGAVQGSRDSYRTRANFYRLLRNNKRSLQYMMKEKGAYTTSLPTNLTSSALCIYFIGLEFQGQSISSFHRREVGAHS